MGSIRSSSTDPHAGQSVMSAGPDPREAEAALVMIHGRGASAASILSLYPALDADHLAALAPQAAGSTWYPYSFLSPIAMNQPYLDSALRRVETIVDQLIATGIASDRIALLGFSQGACLTLEFVARHPRRYGAVMGLLGGLIGPPGTPREYTGSLDATPIFIGASDPDPHIPFERAVETQIVLRRMGAEVELRRYPDAGHTIVDDELDVCRVLLQRISPRVRDQQR